MNFSTWAIRNPIPSIALFLVLVVAGLVSFASLPVTRFPNLDFPLVTVSVGQAGVAPSELVTQVTRPIEDSIASLAGLDHISSVTADSSVVITVQFELDTDSDRALNDVKDAVAAVRGDLPEGVSEPIVRRLDVTGEPIMTYAVSDVTRSLEDLSDFVDDVIARDLQNVDGVGRVSRIGGADRAVLVELDPDRLLALGITAAEVSGQLSATATDVGGGTGDLGRQSYSIRTLGSSATLADLAATPIALSGGRTARLDDLGSVLDGSKEPTSFATYDGQAVVAFGVYRATGASDLAVAEGVKELLPELLEANPNVSVSLIDDTTDYTEGNYESAMETLYEGAALAVFVVFLFLRNWRATVITALALPLSIIPTFLVMELLGFTLNIVSLLGITLVTGILVDDAIVEIENIDRHIRMGDPPYQASMRAAEEIGLTVVAISLTIVAVFAPVSFMSGIAGQYFKQFGLTVAVAVLFSLLVARLLTPMFAAYFLKPHRGGEEERDGWLMRRYLATIAWTTRNRGATLALGLLVFAGSIYSATLLPGEFIPAEDEGRTVVSVELPPGSTLDDTRDATDLMTARLREHAEVRSVFVMGGAGDVGKATVIADLGPREERELSSDEIEAQLEPILRSVPDVRANFLSDGQRPVLVDVVGDSVGATEAAAAELAAAMSGLPELRNVTNSAALGRPEIRLTPMPGIAAELGVTAAAIASTIRIATIGDSEANLAKFTVGDQQVPVIVRVQKAARDDLFRLRNIRIPRAGGPPVPLFVLADIQMASGPGVIERYDRMNRVQVAADLAEGAVLGPAMAALEALPVAQDMPEGTQILRSGDAEIMGDVFASFGLAMGAGLLMVYIVLVLLFSSFVTPIAILLSLPLSVGGAILALYLTDRAISLPVVIGFLMLMGIVTKNAIMLVEFAQQSMHNGMPRAAALIDAGHKRARPIIMTTIAMIAGMMPSALGAGAGGEFRSPMAIAVIGGLIVSTLLSLLFVPTLFGVIDSTRARITGWIRGDQGGAAKASRTKALTS
jgi:hydrophobe/amphiphile efflux-1 (HAE1) family protein